jgi:hypothetical protein
VLLTGDASGVARISASRIFERAQPEQFLEPLKFSADAIFAANVEAERKRPSRPSIAISFRGPHRNFSTSRLPGAAGCRIGEQQRCSANYFPFVIGAYHTLPCVAIHSQ